MYQMVSPESLPSSCGRKSSLKSSNKEENNGATENGRIIPTSSEDNTFENNGLLMHKSSSPSLKIQTQAHYNNHHHNYFSHFGPSNIANSHQSPQRQNHHPSESGHHSNLSHGRGGGGTGTVGGGCGSGDVLLQWGQRKRSRCSRTEARSSSSVEKLVNITLPPPPPPPPSLPSTSSIRGGGAKLRPNGLLSGKDFASGKNRNLEDPANTSPSKNGGSSRAIAISRSTVVRRSNSSMDKTGKKCSTVGSIRKEKSDDSNHHNVDENGGVAHLATPIGGGGGGGGGDGEKGNGGGGGEVVEWPRIYISLSRKEKEEDFYAMKGTKLPHRPKKRAKAIDRTLQYCFPGLWLSDLTRARYEVRERKSAKKQPKRRGLKGLENMDSDSE